MDISKLSMGSEVPEDKQHMMFEREGVFAYYIETPLSKTGKLVWKATDELAKQNNAMFEQEHSGGVSSALGLKYAVETVVLKFAPGSMGDNRTKIENEWAAMKALGEAKHPSARHFLAPLDYVHPNTCTYSTELADNNLEWKRLGHSAFIVMPYVQGRRLLEVVSTLSTEPIDAFERINQIRSYCEQLIDILSLLDSIDTKIVHRDISPNNVMVDDNNQLYLIDFDRCVVISNHKTEPYRLISEGGTPGYQSLEVNKKRYDIDNRADQYSVAALIFNLLTGKPPIDDCGDKLQAQISEHLSCSERDYVEWIAPLCKAMSTNKEDRYGSAQAFGVAILKAFDSYKSRINTTPYQKASEALTQARDDVNDYAQLIEQAMGDIKGSAEHLTSIEALLSNLEKTQQTKSQKNNQKQSTKTQQDKSTQSNELHKQLLTSLKEITTNTRMTDWLQTAQQIEGEVTQQQSDIKRYLSKLSRLEEQAKTQHNTPNNTQRQGSGTRQKTIQTQSKPQGLVDIEAVIADSPWSSIEKDVTDTLVKKEDLLASHQALIPLLAAVITQIPLNNNITGLTQAFATCQKDLRGLLLSYKEKQSSLRGTRAGKSDEVVTRLSTHIDNQQSDADGLEEKKESFEELHTRLTQQVKALSQKLPPSFTPALAQTQNQAESTNADAQKTQSNSLNSVSLNELASILKQQQTHHANHSSLVQSYTSLVEHAWSKSYWQKEWKVATERKLLPVLLIGLGAASFAYLAGTAGNIFKSEPWEKQIEVKGYSLTQGKTGLVTLRYPHVDFSEANLTITDSDCAAQTEKSAGFTRAPTHPDVTLKAYDCLPKRGGELAYQVDSMGDVIKEGTVDVKTTMASLIIDTTPPDTTINLVNSEVTYSHGMSLPFGDYEVEVSADGYETRLQVLALRNEKEQHQVTLEKREETPIAKNETQGADATPPKIITSGQNDVSFGIKQVPLNTKQYKQYIVKNRDTLFSIFKEAYPEEVNNYKQFLDKFTSLVNDKKFGLTDPTSEVQVLQTIYLPIDEVLALRFISIPAGKYMMGCVPNDTQCYDDEKDRLEITISPFRLLETKVTWAMYQPCIDADVCDDNDSNGGHNGWGKGNRPVIEVSYSDIVNKYIPWLEKQTGERYRLPSEAEWEYAARGVAGDSTNTVMTKYSWGNDIGRNKANCDGCGSEFDGKKTAPVATFDPNGFGLYDMHGNVWEWTQDCWKNSFKGRPQTNEAWEVGNCYSRVLRGGSWGSFPGPVRASYRSGNGVTNRNIVSGFRLAQDL